MKITHSLSMKYHCTPCLRFDYIGIIEMRRKLYCDLYQVMQLDLYKYNWIPTSQTFHNQPVKLDTDHIGRMIVPTSNKGRVS